MGTSSGTTGCREGEGHPFRSPGNAYSGPEVLQIVENKPRPPGAGEARIKLLVYNLLPNGKRIKGYGTYRGEIELFREDWATLFQMLQEGRIKPVIAAEYPLLQAARANELLESGRVTGNIVLLAPVAH